MKLTEDRMKNLSEYNIPNAGLTDDEIQQILKNQDNIEPDKAFEYVMKNHYDEVREAVFEQEAENRHE